MAAGGAVGDNGTEGVVPGRKLSVPLKAFRASPAADRCDETYAVDTRATPRPPRRSTDAGDLHDGFITEDSPAAEYHMRSIVAPEEFLCFFRRAAACDQTGFNW
jgi:hypothetical protein